MLSKKTKYAIKALMVLGRNYGKEPMQIVKIAEEERIPKKIPRADSLRNAKCRDVVF